MVLVKVHKNKRNNQLVMTIPRKSYPFLDKKTPKSVNLKLKKGDFTF